MPIRNTKTEAQYKEEFNSLIVGATAMLGRAVQVRKNLASLGKRGNHYSTGPVALATGAAYKALLAIKTFTGAFERNATTR
jgi:hypothetical protein